RPRVGALDDRPENHALRQLWLQWLALFGFTTSAIVRARQRHSAANAHTGVFRRELGGRLASGNGSAGHQSLRGSFTLELGTGSWRLDYRAPGRTLRFEPATQFSAGQNFDRRHRHGNGRWPCGIHEARKSLEPVLASELAAALPTPAVMHFVQKVQVSRS